MTLKLWADERTDGDAGCCSPEAVRGARALAHSLGVPHLTLDLETAFRRERRRRLRRRVPGGGDAEPVRASATATCGSTRWSALADRLGASASRPATTRALADDGDGPLLAAAADAAKDQTYMLSGLRPATLAACASRSRADEAARCASSPPPPGCRSPPSARARTSASSRERASARSSSATAGSPTARARSSTARAPSLGEHAGHHHFTVGQRRGLGVGDARAALRARDRRRGQPRHRRPRARSSRRPIASRLRGARLHRDSGSRRPRQLRYHSRSIACRVSAAGARRARRARAGALGARVRRRARPDRMPARRRPRRRPGDDRGLADLDWRSMKSSEIRETFLSFFEERGHLRDAVGVAGPGARRHLDAADRRRDAAVQALLPRAGGAAGAAAHVVAALLPDPGHRGGREHPPAPHLLRDARQLLLRRLLQARGDRSSRWELSREGFGFDAEQDLDHRLRRRRGARPRPGRGGDRALEGDRACPRSGSSCSPRSENFWQAGRPGRAGPAPSSTSTAAPSSATTRAPRRRHRALPRVLEPRVHGATSCTRTAR